MKVNRNITAIAVTIAFCVVSIPASGRPLSLSQAKANALAFIKKYLIKEQMTEGRWSVIDNDSMTLAAQNANCYVFNIGSNNGFVVAAGDDCAPAVLGYSDKGHVGATMPDNMKAWLDEYGQQMEMQKTLMGAAVNDKSSVAEREAIAPMLTTKWGQDNPFNLKCPSYFPLMHCPTGCVATAMSQILYYNRKSSVCKTAADIEDYTTKTNQYHIEFVESGTEIDWDNMLDSYSLLSPQCSKQAVASLMSYCGAALQTDYRPDGASANSADVVYPLGEIYWVEGYSGDFVATLKVFEPLPLDVETITYIEPDGEPFSAWGANWKGETKANLIVESLRANQKLFEYHKRKIVK
jgi:hypothetical protein